MNDLEVRLKYKKSEADDWTKVEDKALRKKLQNRLAKRKSRTTSPKGKRGKKPSAAETLQAKFETSHSETASSHSEESSLTSNGDTSATYDAFAVGSYISGPPFVNVAPSLVSSEEPLFASFFATPGLSEHQYIRLTQYSLLRALVLNAKLLALEPEALADDDALSPWTVSNPHPNLVPCDLTPTPIQLCTPHHPYLDILTPPKLRDCVLLTLMGNKLEDQLCYDMHLDAFRVWGSQPWNAFAWEVTQTFATNWAWLMDEDLVRSSNFWRAERGELPLVLPDLGGSIVGEVF
ncbi:hypothetical protein P7C71_g4434, partial [Lecanoromycetidae sp. Uapishka_2]